MKRSLLLPIGLTVLLLACGPQPDERTRALFLSKVPARRIGEPEEVGALAVYLASRASDFMTGQTLYLDGGQTISW